ncbi:MAG TPA: extracellular solute-binding protein [Dehalococcoidia bacterium]|nr:extracellular solute-binding protein [Dehalococcoidia bacterium]
MWRRVLALPVLLGLLALAACASEEKATPAPASPTAVGAKPEWQQEWDTVVEAAKKEGKVAVVAPTGAENRPGLTEPFERKYGIKVEYMAVAGAEHPPRIKAERDAGQYLWDIHIGGTTTIYTALKPMGVLDPMEPALILPEVKDPKNWREGKLNFLDKDRLVLNFVTYASEPFLVNPNLVKPEEFKSYRDLLDPRWKGKIVVRDPTVSGPGQARFVFYWWHKDLGPDFVRALAGQDLVRSRDPRLELEWLAQGKYSICIGCALSQAPELDKPEIPIRPLDARQMKEGGYLTTGWGNVFLYNKAPHPNAAKVYINWLLSREGQTEALRAAGEYASRRLDVPLDRIKPLARPVDGWPILLDGEEGVLELRVKAQPFLRDVFGN